MEPEPSLKARLWAVAGQDWRRAFNSGTRWKLDGAKARELRNLDATAKDNQNKDTLGEQGYVDFHFSGDTHAAKIGGGHPFQRRIRPTQPGTLDCWGTIDDAQSNRITLNFRRR